MSKKFTDVEFRRQHPAASVADHEVLMSFENDADALNFEEWWYGIGSALFQKYLDDTSE